MTFEKNIVKTNSLYSRCQPCSICFSFISIIKHLLKVRNCLKYLKKINFYIVLKSWIDLSFCNTYLRNSIKYPFCNIKETLTFLIKDIWLKIRYHIRKICIWKKEFFFFVESFHATVTLNMTTMLQVRVWYELNVCIVFCSKFNF